MSIKIGKLPPVDPEVKSRTSTSEEVQIPKKVVVAIIKPDAVKDGLVDQIIEEIKSNGLEIIKQEERILTKEEAAEFYKQHEGSDHFEQLIEFMSSGPCMTLAITKPGDDIGEDLLPEFRSLIGPLDVNTAKEEAPSSLRAKYGKDSIQNAVHSCDSNESAARELAFFFPDFNTPVVERLQKKKRLQRTLALIRPNALRKRRDSILKTIEDSGFLIAMQKEVQLEREQVENLYAEHKDKDYFENLVTNMTCGPSLALCLAREDAVQVWRDMLGPKEIQLPPSSQGERGEGEQSNEEEPDTQPSSRSLREKFSDPEDEINPLHGADTEEQVQREMNLFFPMETTVAVIKPDVYEKESERELIMTKIKEAGFKISAHKEVTLNKELASMFYKEHEGKEFFNSLTDFMASGPTQFLILSREDAVSGFRSLMGPTAPEHAKEVDPNSLRAQFGTDELMNAVHGSSSVNKAINVIQSFFPDVQLDDNGMLIEPESSADKKNKNEEGEVNANDQKEVANGDVKVEDKTTEDTPKESNGEAVKKNGDKPTAETAETEGEDKKEEETTATETTETPKAEDATVAPEEVKVTEAETPKTEDTAVAAADAETPKTDDAPSTSEPAKTEEENATTEEDKKEEPTTTEADAADNSGDAENKDTPSTVWDPAVGDEVATLESKHVLETTTSSSSPPLTKSIEEDPTPQQPNMEESPSSGSPPLSDVQPPVEGGEVTQDQGEATDPSKEEDASKVAENSLSKEDITASPSTTSAGTEGSGGAENATTVDSSASTTDAVTSSTSNEANNNDNSTNSDETATISREPSTTNASIENVEKVENSTEDVVEQQQDEGTTKVVENEHSEVTPQHQTDGGKTETILSEATDSTASVTADQSAVESGVQPPKAETAADNAKPSAEA